MSVPEPAPIVTALCQVLHDAGVGVYSPTDPLPADVVPIAVSGWPATHDTAVVLTTYSGSPEPDSINGWEFPRLQVRVRATSPLDALRVERDTWRALQFTAAGPGPRDLPGGGWWLQDCYALQSEAEPMGRDENGRWEYVRNYQLEALPNLT